MRWAPDVPGHGTRPYPGSWYDLMASRYLIFSFAMVAWLPEATPSVEDYAADLASRLLGSLDAPPEAASVYSLPITSFRFEWLVVW
jgi:hypothetical protein